MPNRIIKDSICTSENLNALTNAEEVFFYRLMVNCDDYGCFDARPSILRARLFPLRLSMVTEKQILTWLQALIDRNLIFLYESEGHFYLQMVTWFKHQQVRAAKRKFPAPDINGNHLLASDISCTRNPIQSNPNPNPNPNPKRERLAALAENFELFWRTYPKKKSKNEAREAFLKLSPDEQLLAAIMAKIEQAKTSDDWLKQGGEFIPYPATFLNKRRWEDEYTRGGGNGANQAHSEPDHEPTREELERKWQVGTPLT